MAKRKKAKSCLTVPVEASGTVKDIFRPDFAEHARMLICVQCPDCDGRGMIAHPFDDVIFSLKGVPEEQVAGLLTKKGREIVAKGKGAPTLTCKTCKGNKQIEALVSFREVFGTFFGEQDGTSAKDTLPVTIRDPVREGPAQQLIDNNRAYSRS